MKYLFTICFLVILSVPLFSQSITGRLSSSVYMFERFDTVDVSNTHTRAYQMLNLNISQDNVSLRSYMNFETDFSKTMKDDTRLRFYNLYLEARNLFDIATLKLGRQPQFNSVVGGVFDGANLELKKNKFKLSGFYGANVPAYQKLEVTENWKDDYVLGASFSTTVVNDFRFGLNYVNKNFKPLNYMASRLDEDLNPIQVEIRNKSNQYEFLSGEISYWLKDIIYVDTRYDYDLNFETTSRFEISGRYEKVKNLGISAYYNYREPKIRYNSIFSVFDFGNTQEIEVGGDYRIDKNFTVLGKFGNVTYEDENSQRITGGLITSWGTFTYRKNLGYAGELDAVSIYAARTYFEGLLTPSLGIAYTSYKLSADDDKNNLTTLLAGINVRPVRLLSFDLQGQYMDNKIYRNDFRFFFKINYWFNTNLNLM
jgi:hypothetical protein